MGCLRNIPRAVADNVNFGRDDGVTAKRNRVKVLSSELCEVAGAAGNCVTVSRE